MKRVTNILFSSILLVLIFFGTLGVGVEKCSCTGRISLTTQTSEGCCDGESSCMVVKAMHLSDYMPTSAMDVSMPLPPLLFPVFPTINQNVDVAWRRWQLDSHRAKDPPGVLAHSVAVLRV